MRHVERSITIRDMEKQYEDLQKEQDVLAKQLEEKKEKIELAKVVLREDQTPEEVIVPESSEESVTTLAEPSPLQLGLGSF